MSSDTPPPLPPSRRLSDPRALRALSHPVRLSLLDLLREVGPLTATEAGERLGESPANCSFHLRTLAKYGFVEEAEGGRGRQRPWRTVNAITMIDAEHGDPESNVAAESLVALLADRFVERVRTWQATSHNYPTPWREVSEQSYTTIHLTVEELRELSRAGTELILRYRRSERSDPNHRPPGAVPVTVAFFAFPSRPPTDSGTD